MLTSHLLDPLFTSLVFLMFAATKEIKQRKELPGPAAPHWTKRMLEWWKRVLRSHLGSAAVVYMLVLLVNLCRTWAGM